MIKNIEIEIGDIVIKLSPEQLKELYMEIGELLSLGEQNKNIPYNQPTKFWDGVSLPITLNPTTMGGSTTPNLDKFVITYSSFEDSLN